MQVRADDIRQKISRQRLFGDFEKKATSTMSNVEEDALFSGLKNFRVDIVLVVQEGVRQGCPSFTPEAMENSSM